MSELLDHVERSIRTRRLFRPGQRILVAVSGGADSMVLLHLLCELAPKHGWQVTAAHFNHQLRGRSSAADERLVRRTAQRLELPLLVGQGKVRKFARTRKLSVEMAARELRHQFLAQTARRLRIPSVALAHHADDQLELFFLRLLRGSGGEGLAGMKWRNPSPSDPEIALVHPLLDQPKAVLIEYATDHGIRHREDASNAVLDFQRNRVRHELLPLLRKKYQPALDRTIPRVMEIIGAEAAFTAEAAREWLAHNRTSHWRDSVLECASPLATCHGKVQAILRHQTSPPFEELPVAVQRRCVQLQLLNQGIVADFELVEQLRLTAERPVAVGRAQAQEDHKRRMAGEPVALYKVRRVGRKGDKLGTGGTPVLLSVVREPSGLVRFEAAEAEMFQTGGAAVELQGGAGEVEFAGARFRWRIDSRKAVERPKAGAGVECFDADKVGSPVLLRHWRPGDRFQPIGMASPIKLQDFFTNQKVPRGQRRQLIMAATAKGEVFWVEGMRISERFKLTKPTIRCLQWRWKRL